MGANPTQAAGVMLFIVAFVLVGLSLFSGGSVLWLLIAAALMVVSGLLFLKAKPWEGPE